MSEWDGEERRSTTRDHDLLTKIDANLSNFMSRFEEHKKEDGEHFDRLYVGQSMLKKYLYMGLGVLAAIEFFSFFKK